MGRAQEPRLGFGSGALVAVVPSPQPPVLALCSTDSSLVTGDRIPSSYPKHLNLNPVEESAAHLPLPPAAAASPALSLSLAATSKEGGGTICTTCHDVGVLDAAHCSRLTPFFGFSSSSLPSAWKRTPDNAMQLARVKYGRPGMLRPPVVAHAKRFP